MRRAVRPPKSNLDPVPRLTPAPGAPPALQNEQPTRKLCIVTPSYGFDGLSCVRLAIEINWSQKDGGARRVAVNIVRLLEHGYGRELCVLTNATNSLFSDVAVAEHVLRAPVLVPQLMWDQIIFPHIVLPLVIKRLQPKLTLFTNNLMSVWGARPAIVIMHDLTPFVIPETYLALHGIYQRWYFRRAARHALHIVTVSEYSKADIVRILGVPGDRVSVIPLGSDLLRIAASAPADIPAAWGIERCPFVLYVGALHPRKNLDRLLEAFAQLKSTRSIPHRLVIVGTARWKRTRALDRARRGPYGTDIIVPGRVDDTTLAQLYRRCAVFVYPSISEGFGLPVLEAMSMGAPVVTSAGTSLAEVAGNAAVLVNPLQVDSIRDGIAAVIFDDVRAEQLRVLGRRRAARFSWARAAAGMLEVIENQLDKLGEPPYCAR